MSRFDRDTGPRRQEWLLFLCSVSRPSGYLVRGWVAGLLVAFAVIALLAGAWIPLAAACGAIAGFALWIADDVIGDYRSGRLACDCSDCRVRLTRLTGRETPWEEPRAQVLAEARAARTPPSRRP